MLDLEIDLSDVFPIKVGHRVFNVSHLNPSQEEYETHQAYIDFEKSIVFIHPDLETNFLKTILLHEILHACFEFSGIHELLLSSPKVSNLEEIIIRSMSNNLIMILKDNPKFAKFISYTDQ